MIEVLSTLTFETGPQGEPVGDQGPDTGDVDVARLRTVAQRGADAEQRLQEMEDETFRRWQAHQGDDAA